METPKNIRPIGWLVPTDEELSPLEKAEEEIISLQNELDTANDTITELERRVDELESELDASKSLLPHD